MNTVSRTPAENFALLQACETQKAAHDFLAGLPLTDVIKLYSVDRPGLKCGDILLYPRTYTPDGETPDVSSPEQAHMNQVYASLFSLIKSARQKAHRNGKQLQVIVGDVHMDRTALSLMAMTTYICRQLGISDMGVELPERGELKHPSGNMRLGLEEVQAKIRQLSPGEILPEFGGTSVTKQTRNFDFLIQLGMQQGMTVFSNDPKSIITQQDLDEVRQNLHKRIFEDRDPLMRDVLAHKAECVSFYGLGHLQGLTAEPPPDNVERLVISAANVYLNSPEGFPFPGYDDFTVLPTDQEEAKKIGRGKREGESPIVQVMVEGSLKSAKEALEMARNADMEVDKTPLHDDRFGGRRSR